ncbi:MAG: sodium:glutamate symporter [Clostridiales bacterium]|nr:sodium:glutamate symporter [Clostridiales bacterium]
MDYSAANQPLWNFIIQMGMLAVSVLLANILRRRIPFFRRSLMPVSVLAGFILLAFKYTGLFVPDGDILEMLVYHTIAMGFIAMSLRTVNKEKNEGRSVGFKSGAIIVGTYLVQGITGLLITIGLAYTLKPDLFKAAGLLLPMGYGQGPGQANNIGTTYEGMGFVGGRSFGLAIAAAGYLCACVVGVIMLNRWAKKGLLKGQVGVHESENLSADYFQDKNEIPVSDSIDKLSVQVALVLIVYLLTYLLTWGLTSAISAISPGLGKTVNSLLWGFNFIIGSVLAMLTRVVLDKSRKIRLITRQYQNNYLLNRISGFFFDIMIICGIASINMEDLTGLWIPFLLMVVLGALVTWFYLKKVCTRTYGDYANEGLISMYGMLTGTIGSGVLLLREIDPELMTPASGNLVLGSSYAIILGAPMLVFVSLASRSDLMCFVTLGLAILYFMALTWFLLKKEKKAAAAAKQAPEA